MEMNSNEDALDLLMKAYEIELTVFEEDDIRLAPTLTLISNVQSKLKQFDEAL